MQAPDRDPKPTRPARRSWFRQRLVPPRPQGLDGVGSVDGDAIDWAKDLHGNKRSLVRGLLGNALLLFVLLGLPWGRGYRRALETRRAYADLAACLYGGRARAEPGLQLDHDEPEHFAEMWVHADAGWPGRCSKLLSTLAPEPALFVLPGVKGAEEHVRQAVALVRKELSALPKRGSASAIPRRPIKAMDLLRTAVQQQLVQAAFVDSSVQMAVSFEGGRTLPRPARLPLYVAGDAAVRLWGDDHGVRATGLDKTGLSYLQVDPGKPLLRARLTRPRLLRGAVLQGDAHLLVWATPEERCSERAAGCYGKTTGLAWIPHPLLELPRARQFAAHMAGRADRSLALHQGRLWMASETENRRVGVHEFLWSTEASSLQDAPALTPSASWQMELDGALLLSDTSGPLVLGNFVQDGRAKLVRVSANGTTPLADLETDGSAWLTGCLQDQRVAFAFGNTQTVLVGVMQRSEQAGQVHVWSPLSLRIQAAIHRSDPGRDEVVVLCGASDVIVLARDQQRELLAFECKDAEPACSVQRVAQGVDGFSAVLTKEGALTAYAGESEHPQVRLRSLRREPFELGQERVPAACWDTPEGMCGKPSLTRLGGRLLLTAHERSDLAALESPDEGLSWAAPPVF